MGKVLFVPLLIAPGQGGRSMPTDERNGRNVVEKLLNDQSYHIEFNVFLTNHVKHAVTEWDGTS